jgi:hypothetical protein
VPEEVSGVLVRSDHPGGVIVPESQMESNQARANTADKRISALLASKRLGTGNG